MYLIERHFLRQSKKQRQLLFRNKILPHRSKGWVTQTKAHICFYSCTSTYAYRRHVSEVIFNCSYTLVVIALFISAGAHRVSMSHENLLSKHDNKNIDKLLNSQSHIKIGVQKNYFKNFGNFWQLPKFKNSICF